MRKQLSIQLVLSLFIAVLAAVPAAAQALQGDSVSIGTTSTTYPLTMYSNGTQYGSTNFWTHSRFYRGNGSGLMLGYDNGQSFRAAIAPAGTNGSLGFWTDESGTFAERLVIDSDVRALGTFFAGGEGSSYGVRGVTLGAATGDYGTVGYNYTPSASTPNTFNYIAADYASQLYFHAGGLRLRTAPVGTANTTVAFVDALTVLQNGNVGIGTSSPSSKLHVAGAVHATGNITSDGNIAAKYQDVAEWVPSDDDLAPGTVVVLDTTRNNAVTASRQPYDTSVAGVVSAQPGLILGEGGAGKEQIATTGRVMVRVDATAAPIRVGDLLVSGHKPGTAMRSEPLDVAGRKLHQPGTIVGKALEPLAGGEGEILVLLSLQ